MSLNEANPIKNYSFCGPARKYLYSPHRGSLDILNGKRWGLGGGGGWVGLKDLNFKRKKYEPKLEFSDEG